MGTTYLCTLDCTHSAQLTRLQLSCNNRSLVSSCEKSSQSTSANAVSRWATPVGSCTASSTASSPTARCQATRPSVAATTVSTPSSRRPAPASTSREPCSWIWSRPSSMRSEPAPTDSCSTQSSSSPARKTRLTTTREATTPWARSSLTWCSTEPESLLTSALDFKDSSSSTRLAAVPDPVSLRCSWSDFRLTTARSPSSSLPFIQPRRSQPPSSSHTTQF